MAMVPCSACTVIFRFAVRFCVAVPVRATLPRINTSRVDVVPIFCVVLFSTNGFAAVPCSLTSPVLLAPNVSVVAAMLVPAPPTNRSPSSAVNVVLAVGAAAAITWNVLVTAPPNASVAGRAKV